MTLWSTLERRLRTDGSRPLITFYDDGRGERMELSGTSFANAVAKAANAIGDRAATEVEVRLPLHWQLLVWAAAGLTAGAEVTLVEAGRAGREDAAPEQGCVVLDGETLAVSLHPFAMPFTVPLPPGVEDATLVTRVQPDALIFPPLDGTLSVPGMAEPLNWSGLVGRASTKPERAMFTGFPSNADALAAMLAAPLVAGGSIVLVRDSSPVGAGSNAAGSEESGRDHARDEAVTVLWPIV